MIREIEVCHRALASGYGFGEAGDRNGRTTQESRKYNHYTSIRRLLAVHMQGTSRQRELMRKRIHGQAASTEPDWLRVEDLAEVSVSSEDADRPIEFALVPGAGSGWRAATPGEQSVRLRFDEPQAIGLIQLRFDEAEHQRVQEFWLQWSDDRGQTFHPIVRQQFSFSPAGATHEVESYNVALKGATDLELHIVADVSDGRRVATLTSLRLR